ncbi:protoporphyrinogen/coproporphyrinogen oxidase [Microbacterium hominis]|uniref:protoporphyrinogen/coproporphyrinogen oxidase n=1 Tax=Microbacterium hominis TaxID=162426 RepID=UPI001CC31647|nr:FAD-dependent oxidoreductase [Microbacterium hominis]
MSERAEPTLADRARATRVVVVGGGIAGLTAAWECARIGMPVVLLEAGTRVGGAIETATLDGIDIDLAAEVFSLSAPALADLIDQLELRADVEPAADESVAVAVAAGDGLHVVPLPANRAGIPANVWAPAVRRLVGSAGVWRAYLDRLRPPLTIGRERRLGALVRTRMGARIRDRLVAPLTIGTWGVDPDEIDVDLAVPGLSAALTRAGSLGGAVDQLLPARSEDGTEPPRARRATLRGGMGRLVQALAERLLTLDADIRVGHAVTALSRTETGWLVHVDGAGDAVDRGDDGVPQPLPADIVVLAAGAPAASTLLAPLGVTLDAPARPAREVVTLVMDAGTSAAARRPCTRYRARWPRRPSSTPAPPGRACVPRPAPRGASSASPSIPTRAAMTPWLSRRATSRSCGRASARSGRVRSAPRSSHRRRRRSATPSVRPPCAPASRRSGASSRSGEDLAGGGISSVVADTIDEVERVRHDVLWGRP